MKPETHFMPDAAYGVGTSGRAAAVVAGACIVAVLALYVGTARAIVEIWYRSETFAHGFVILPIAAWLVWRKRDVLAGVPVRPFWLGLAFVAGAGSLWLVAELAGVAVGAHLALVLLVQAAVVTVVGLRMAWAVAFPLAFLLFAAPVGEFLVPPFIDWTADFTVAALRATGIPVFREGNHFMIPSGSWSVVEACSGIRYLIASLVVGTLFAHLTYRSALRRAAFIGAAIAVPIVANWLRAYMIVMIGHLSGNRLAAGADHLIYGWVFFGVVILIMFWVGSFWREDDAAAPPPRAPPLPARGSASTGALVVAALATVLVAGGWRPIHAALEVQATAGTPVLAPIAGANGWTAAPAPVDDWRPRYVGPRAELHQTFAKGGRRVGVYVAYYRDQQQDRELVNSQNLLAPDDSRWRQTGSGALDVPWAGATSTARTAELAGPGRRISTARWYWIDGRATASDQVGKLLLAWSKLRLAGDDSAAIVVYTTVPEKGGATEVLRTFVHEMGPALERTLVGARDGK